MISFEANIDQNKYLPADGRVMNAAISLTCTAGAGEIGSATPTAAQVIIIDCSGSMAGGKLHEAKKAAVAAIDVLRDGVAFALISGTTQSHMVYPSTESMVSVSVRTREEAKKALRYLTADGGTVIGTWLQLAGQLLATQKAKIKHAILLTDGRNEHQGFDELLRVLRECEGRFVCDSRGVGTDWDAKTLLAISETLLGTAGALIEPQGLAREFRAIAENVMGKSVGDVSLSLWTPDDVRVRLLQQVSPQIVDLTDRGSPAGPHRRDYPTGQWGAETKIYHLVVEAPSDDVDVERAVARVSVLAGGQELLEQTVWIQWTDDLRLSTQVNPLVAHYSRQTELSESVREGLAAKDAGHIEVATAKLGRAVQLATESGHHDTLKVLKDIVEIIDASTGTVRLLRHVDAVHAEMVMLESRKTTVIRRGMGG